MYKPGNPNHHPSKDLVAGILLTKLCLGKGPLHWPRTRRRPTDYPRVSLSTMSTLESLACFGGNGPRPHEAKSGCKFLDHSIFWLFVVRFYQMQTLGVEYVGLCASDLR